MIQKIYSYATGILAITCLSYGLFIFIAQPFALPGTNGKATIAMFICGAISSLIFVYTQNIIDADKKEKRAKKEFEVRLRKFYGERKSKGIL